MKPRGAVGAITLNRPKQLNAPNATLIGELGRALQSLEANDAVSRFQFANRGRECGQKLSDFGKL